MSFPWHITLSKVEVGPFHFLLRGRCADQQNSGTVITPPPPRLKDALSTAAKREAKAEQLQ